MKEFIHQICFDFIQEYMSEVKSTRIFHLDILMKYHLILENKTLKEACNYISNEEYQCLQNSKNKISRALLPNYQLILNHITPYEVSNLDEIQLENIKKFNNAFIKKFLNNDLDAEHPILLASGL